MKKRTLLISALSVFLLGLSSCDLGVIPTSSALYPDNSNEPATETTSGGGENTSIAPETTSGGTQTSSNEGTNSSASGNTSSQDSGSSSQPVTQYTITFDKNGGTGTKEDETVNAGSTFTLPANPFTYEDHTFTGWQVGLDTTVRAAGYQFTVNANTTLKALWEANPVDTSFVITLDEAPGANHVVLGYAQPKQGDEYLSRTATVSSNKVTLDFGANPGELYSGFYVVELKEGATDFGESFANVERVSEYIQSFATGNSSWYFHVWLNKYSSEQVEMTKSGNTYVLNNVHLNRGQLFTGMFDYGYRWEEVDYTKLDNESTAKSYLTHEDYAPYQYIKTVRGGTFNFTLAANSIKVDLVELDPTAVTVNVNESLKNSGHKVFVEGWDDDDLTPNLYAEATVNGTAITFDLGEDFYGLTGYQILELRDGITSYDGSDYSTKVLRPTTHCDIDDINVAWDDTFKVHYKSISHSDWADVQLQQDTSEPGYYLTGMSFHAGDIFCLCVDNYWLNWNDKNTSKMQSSAFVKDDDTDNIKCTLDGDYIIHASTTDFYIVDADELSAVYKAVINGDQAGAVILDNKQAAISVTSGDHISIYRNDVLQDSISLKTDDNNLREIDDGIFEVIATTEPVGENKNLILNNEGLFLGGYAVDNNYYLRGDMNGWRSLAEYKFTKGTKTGLDEGNGVDAQKDGKDQYFINNLVIENPADFKAFSFTTYYPGTGANLSFTEAGTYNIYFVPEGEITDWNSFDDRGYFWIYKHPVITGITAAYTGSNVVTGEHIVGGISLHVTYDKELEPAVLAPDAEGVFYSLNGGNYITYDEL